MAVASDFVTGPFHAVARGSPRIKGAFPCFIDLKNARTLYVPDLDPRELREAPFANLYARAKAISVVSVPWEAGPINRPRVKADPIYVFSTGRCGSTLLHRILVASNVSSVSEPDIGTALISQTYRKNFLARPILRWATKCFARDLMSALGSEDNGLVVKLRSQFCAAAGPMLKGSRERRTIFMARQFEPWARSVTQAFKRVTPRYLVAEYQQSLKGYAYLRQHSQCLLLRFEDLVAQPRESAAKVSGFLCREISTSSVDRVMGVHSQSGTRLEKVSDTGRANWQEIREETLRLWKANGTAELYEQILGSSARHGP